MNRLILQVFCAIFSGLIEGLAISNEIMPFGSPLLALVCLLPFYVAIYNAKSYRTSFLLFGLQVLTVHLISSFWLANFHGFGIFTLGASAFGTCLEGAFFGILIHAYPHRLNANKSNQLNEISLKDNFLIFKRILWFSTIFTLYEWEKSVGALGYPWGTVSMAAYKFKILNQFVDITGVLGITFLYSLCSAFLGEFYFYIKKSVYYQNKVNAKKNLTQALKFISAIYSICLIYGLFQYFIPREITKNVNTIIVQHNADSWGTSEDVRIRTSMQLTEKAINEFKEKYGEDVDLVLWSEGLLSKIFPDRRSYYETHPEQESLTNFIKRMETPFLIGGTSRPQDSRTANSAILFDKNGKYSGYYSKNHLVPFAELIPYYDSAFMQRFMQKVVKMDSSLMQGYQFVKFKIPLKKTKNYKTPLNYNRELFENIDLDKNGNSSSSSTERYISNNQENPVSFVNFTAPICFEDAFPSVCRFLHNYGSEVFMNITNDSWSNTNAAEYQHFIAASYRAIELRTTLVRCCNAGYSVVVNARGDTIASLPLFEEASVGVKVPIYEHKTTIYAKFGDWFVYILFFSAIFYLIFEISTIYDFNIFEKIKYSRQSSRAKAKNSSDFPDFETDFNSETKNFDLLNEKMILLLDEIKSLQSQLAELKSKVDEKTDSSRNKTASLAEKSANLAEKTASSRRKTVSSANKTASSAKKSAASTKKSASSAKTTVSSASKTATSAKKSVASAKKSASSAKTTASSAKKATTSAKKTATSAKKTATSTTKPTTSAEKNVASVKKSTASAKKATTSSSKTASSQSKVAKSPSKTKKSKADK